MSGILIYCLHRATESFSPGAAHAPGPIGISRRMLKIVGGGHALRLLLEGGEAPKVWEIVVAEKGLVPGGLVGFKLADSAVMIAVVGKVGDRSEERSDEECADARSIVTRRRDRDHASIPALAGTSALSLQQKLLGKAPAALTSVDVKGSFGSGESASRAPILSTIFPIPACSISFWIESPCPVV